mgnify:CR=1 FL=1
MRCRNASGMEQEQASGDGKDDVDEQVNGNAQADGGGDAQEHAEVQ